MENLVSVIGAGGHAKVCAEVLRDIGFDIDCFLDIAGKSGEILGRPIFSSDNQIDLLKQRKVNLIFIAVGDNDLRERLVAEFKLGGFQFVSAISSRAMVSETAQLGTGVVIMPGAVVSADAVIGDFAILNSNSCVEHDSIIGPYSHIGPGATLAGNVKLGSHVFFGAGAVAIPWVEIGSRTTIGAGATVISSMGPDLVSVGTPARAIGTVSLGEK